MKKKKMKIITLSLYTIFALGISANANEETRSLGTVDVNANSSELEKQLYTVPDMDTSTKLNLSVRETPQSVKVISKQKMEDFGIDSYDDLLNNVTGVTLNRWDERVNASARGFVIDYYKVDGMPTYTEYNERDLDLSIYERVEIVRGANGLTTGNGNPAMSINLVRKKANSKELTADIVVKGGSWNAYSAMVDIGNALNDDGTIRGRVVLKHSDEDSFMDGYEKESNLVYGVVDIDASDSTYLSLGASYQELDRSGVRWGGLPAFYSDGSRTNLDRSTVVSEDWTYANSEIFSIFASLEQVLHEDITLNASYTFDQIKNDSALLYFSGAINKADGSGLNYTDWQSEKKNEEHNLDINVKIPFETEGLEHEIVTGITYNLAKQPKYEGRYPAGGTVVSNFFNYNIPLVAPSGADGSYVDNHKIEQNAVYLAGKFSLMQNLKLISGARLSNWEYENIKGTQRSREFKNELTPYAGLVYDLDENHSIYTSYTSIFKTQSQRTVDGKHLDPIEGKSYEAGIKGEYFDGDLITSLSIFRVEQDGVAQQDGSKKVTSNPSEDAYKAAKGVTSKGVEFDITGKVTDNFTVDFGLATFEAKDAAGDNFNTKASRTSANLAGTYSIADFVLGAGLQYKSKFYTGTGATKITQDAYTLANAMVGYKINKQTKLQLNIDNLFDKKYYEGIGTNGMSYGEPLKATLTLKYSF